MRYRQANHTQTTETSQQGKAPASRKAPAAGTSLHPILRLQQTIGNRAVNRLLRSRGPQSEPSPDMEAPPIVDEVLAAPGHDLDAGTRGFMESRFGEDFSEVRVHSDAKAAESARAVNALAYTSGRDVVFGAGQYQPNTSEGRKLLAHELTHTIQQGPPAAAPIIARKNGDQLKSELHPAGKAHLYADQVASVYFPTKKNVPDQDDHKVLKALAQEYVYTAQRKGGLKGKVIGHADVEMSTDPDNDELSFQRARWTAAAFKFHLVEAAADTGKVLADNLQFDVEGAGTGFCLGDPDCKGKANPDALAQYRRADVMIFTEKATTDPEIPSCPPASGAAAKTLGEYIQLIGCAEVTTGYSPGKMLAMLRQLYYGKDWSATDKNPLWEFVIPCSPNLGNPKDKLGATLFDALAKSATVEGTDVGHIFTGLEAMTCPSPSVTLEKRVIPGLGIDLTVNLSNESFATWGGDLGAAAGTMTACWMMTNEQREKHDQCHKGSDPKGLMYYFTNVHAQARDLEGDIAPFVMRAAASGACSGTLEKTFSPQSPISTIFKNYFYNLSPAGQTSKNRYQCFAEAIGAKVVKGKIENRGELFAKYEEKVLSFAWAHYVNVKHEIPRSDPTAQTLLRHSKGALGLFFDWLVRSRLGRRGSLGAKADSWRERTRERVREIQRRTLAGPADSLRTTMTTSTV
jgi:outer membrane protein OmpA-like peptidoglycan-associated protein